MDKIKEMDATEKEIEAMNKEVISEAGGEYEYLRKSLGNFPDNLIYDFKKHNLSDLIDKSMSLGEINLNISNM